LLSDETARRGQARPGEAVPALIRIWRYTEGFSSRWVPSSFFDYDEGMVHFLGDTMAGRAQRYTGMDR
jgi:hypothetical protein